MNIPFAKIESFAIPQKEDGTVAMKCVYLDVIGQRLMATDGHRAARVSIGIHSDDVSGLIPREVFDLARKELKIISGILGKGTIPDPQLKVIAGPDSVIIENLLTTTTHIVNRPKLEEGKVYPNVDVAFRALESEPSVTLDPGLLAEVLAGLDGGAVSLWISSAEKAVTIAATSGKAISVVMPMTSQVDLAEINKRGMSQGSMHGESPLQEAMKKTVELVNSGALDTPNCKVTASFHPARISEVLDSSNSDEMTV